MKNKGEALFEAVNLIDDDLIDEAAFERIKRKTNKKYVFFSLAACVILFVGVFSVVNSTNFFGINVNDETSTDFAMEDVNLGEKLDENPVYESILAGVLGGSMNSDYYMSESNLTNEENFTQTDLSGMVNEGSDIKDSAGNTSGIVEATSAPQYAENSQESFSQTFTSPEEESTIVDSVTIVGFCVRVLEINGMSITVECVDSTIYEGKLVFSARNLEDIGVQEGDYVNIETNGTIMETYPAQINVSSWSLAE